MWSSTPSNGSRFSDSIEAGQAIGQSDRPVSQEHWGWAEAFIGSQVLFGLLFFLPGVQPYRAWIRALPYLSAMGALVYYFRRPTGQSLHPSAPWLLLSLVLLVVNLLHPTSHLLAGFGQVAFQLSIAAPLFWMSRAVRSETRLLRILWIVFATNAFAALVGVLQVYRPAQFLPPEFSALGLSLNPDIVDALTYRGAGGRDIVRPPGLSDLPGAAAVSGMLAAILGIALATRRQAWWISAGCLVAAAVGMTALYLTQVRALTLMAVGGVGLFGLVQFRQGRLREGAASLLVGSTLVIGGYVWAVTLGGEVLSDRFADLVSEGVLRTYDANRGQFLRYTLFELIYEYPFGAGIGRWGMMQVYFGDSSLWQARAIHVEIQPTGWLLDGGVPMWVLYGGALAVALRATYRYAVRGSSRSLQDLSAMVFCVQCCVVGLCLAGPAFNTTLAIQFWALTGALFGAGGASDDGDSTDDEDMHDEAPRG